MLRRRIDGDAINGRRKPGATRRGHQIETHARQFHFVSADLHAQIELEIEMPERQAHHLACAGQLRRGIQTGQRFDQRHDYHRIAQQGCGRLQRRNVLGFRHHHATQAASARGAQGAQIVFMPDRVGGVDAHQRSRPVCRAEQGQMLHHVVASRVFFVQRHGIFQIQDDAVGSGLQGLGKTLRTRGRHKKKTARTRNGGIHETSSFASKKEKGRHAPLQQEKPNPLIYAGSSELIAGHSLAVRRTGFPPASPASLRCPAPTTAHSCRRWQAFRTHGTVRCRTAAAQRGS
ncbi:hypothetical protein SDC9_133178 [bioreactor metagenome]|uniref:Uncharacterized protein n=1 Tax=bioreactor metagenome TaxID=1076179 RepID=A0A645DA44_9ZZZZ